MLRRCLAGAAADVVLIGHVVLVQTKDLLVIGLLASIGGLERASLARRFDVWLSHLLRQPVDGLRIFSTKSS